VNKISTLKSAFCRLSDDSDPGFIHPWLGVPIQTIKQGPYRVSNKTIREVTVFNKTILKVRVFNSTIREVRVFNNTIREVRVFNKTMF
jgi:hypothetical protein